MFTTNPSTGERSSKNFQPIQCLWNVSYYIGTLHTHPLANVERTDHQGMGWWTKQWPPVRGLNPVRQLKWTTVTCINPSMFFVLFSSVTKNTTRFIFKIQNPSLEIKRDPSHVTFFNIGHEARREIDNIKCPSVYRLTQIQNIFSMCISWHGYVWKEIIFIGLAHPFFTVLYCPEEENLFFFNWFSYIPNEFKILSWWFIATMIAYHRLLSIEMRP